MRNGLLNTRDNTYNEIREKSMEQWLKEMEQHEDVEVRCGVRLVRDYMQHLKEENFRLQQQSELKDEYLKKLKNETKELENETKELEDETKELSLEKQELSQKIQKMEEKIVENEKNSLQSKGDKIMRYEDVVEKVRAGYEYADARMIFEHIAIQVNIVGEGEGAFYIEVAERSVTVEPYDYYDRDVLITAPGQLLCDIAAGKMTVREAIENGSMQAVGNMDKLRLMEQIILPAKKPQAKKKSAAKKETVKKETVKKETVKKEK